MIDDLNRHTTFEHMCVKDSDFKRKYTGNNETSKLKNKLPLSNLFHLEHIINNINNAFASLHSQPKYYNVGGICLCIYVACHIKLKQHLLD